MNILKIMNILQKKTLINIINNKNNDFEFLYRNEFYLVNESTYATLMHLWK